MYAGSGSTGGGEASDVDTDVEPVRSVVKIGRCVAFGADSKPSDVGGNCMLSKGGAAKGTSAKTLLTVMMAADSDGMSSLVHGAKAHGNMRGVERRLMVNYTEI